MNPLDYQSPKNGKDLIDYLCNRLHKKGELFTDGNVMCELRKMDSATLTDFVKKWREK